MGMLIDGQWVEEDRIIIDGTFHRAQSAIVANELEPLAAAISANPKRFILLASRSCPWSHRVVLMCGLKQLCLPTHFAFGERVQGYALNGGGVWRLPGTDKPLRHLHQVYVCHDPSYTGRVTVPVLWDSAEHCIVSNESANLLSLLDKVHPNRGPDFTLRPPSLHAQIESANDENYHGLNNAVYRAGFATKQEAYDAAVMEVFNTLDRLERHLATSRYYFGTVISDVDLRLFPTLVRFDAIYAILFKCAFRRLVDYPNLWAYARDLYALKSVASSVDFEQMRHASYLADSNDLNPIVAIAPDVDWTEPHGRNALGVTQVWLRSGQVQTVSPATLHPLEEPI